MTANYKLVYHGNKANLPAVRDAGSFYLCLLYTSPSPRDRG